MSCDICGRQHHPQRLPFLCAVDARNKLYEGRLAHAHILMENDKLEQEVNALLGSSSSSSSFPLSVTARSPSSRRIGVDSWSSEQQEAIERTNEIIAQADRLRVELKAAREEIESRKEAISRRKADLASASDGIEARRLKRQQDVERSISMIRSTWDIEHDCMAHTRSFLCMEAARLYGLRRQKKGSSTRYEIGGIEIVELHAMNSTPPEVISTCLAHMTHILMLASNYLAIRLPAEITLPHRDYPRPTIFSLAASYSHRARVPIPGASGFTSQIPPESRDRGQHQHNHHHQRPSRPRPLFVEKPLPTLAKEDPSTYSLFIEGVALLAYDIAWTCSSQGVPIGDKTSTEDVCNMGRNLYNLLIGNQLHANQTGQVMFPALSSSSPPTPNRNESESESSSGRAGSTATVTTATQIMGRYSHGTAHTFLGSAAGSELIRGFKIPNPIKLADRLKSKLSSEAPIPDWELLEDDAWTMTDGPHEGDAQHGHRPKRRV